MKKDIIINQIVSFLGEKVLKLSGEIVEFSIRNISSVKNTTNHSLDWISIDNSNKLSYAENSNAKVLICDESVPFSQKLANQSKILIHVADPKYCILEIGQHFFVERPKPNIDISAKIHIDAVIGKNAFIGANVVIGACKIGENVVIHPNVVINDPVIIGNNVTIDPGAVLGYDGFGYEKDNNGNLTQFPQLGMLIIHDNVEIGANTCIDRGALSDTIIGYNTKINNLCHIAHNVVIGKNVIITAQVNISGSTTIEDDVWVAPNSTFRGHQTIGKGATIGMGSVVTKNVPSGETWFGCPAKKKEL